jgi:hypothetical protein
MRLFRIAVLGMLLGSAGLRAGSIDPASLMVQPLDFKGVTLSGAQATLQNSSKWSFLLHDVETADAKVSVTFNIQQPATELGFFGRDWSVWPDLTYSDGGFDAAILLHGSDSGGYRVQVSHKYQTLALVKWPNGGYLRVVPCEIKQGQPQSLSVTYVADTLRVELDGVEKIKFRDLTLPIAKGKCGFGVSAKSRVTFENFSIGDAPPQPPAVPAPQAPDFSVRKFLGGRQWVFDGDEPILLLPVPEASYINNVKLRPGYKPQLSWNSHWDVQCQGAYKEADNAITAVEISGSGSSLTAKWEAHHVKDRFIVRTSMQIGFDPHRNAYVYFVDSEMEVLGKEPFLFRYGYDFEHHTPLDPFQWQYLVCRRDDQSLYYRPVYPVDPGPQNNLAQKDGLRVWYGRHNEKMLVAPAVEYAIDPGINAVKNQKGETVARKMNTAVCAAFYDTGVSFESETAAPGTRVRVKYRYTGYPADEAEALYKAAVIYPAPMLDPKHHYIFADEWPKLTFSKFKPMNEAWGGLTPFMSGHNQRPSYDLVKDAGTGSGFAMRLGPNSFAKAPLKPSEPLAPGRYTLSALVKSVNAHGPGGRIELEVLEQKTNAVLSRVTHYVGNGSFDWTKTLFGFDVPDKAGALSVAFGNVGTGEMQITDVEFAKHGNAAIPPPGPKATPPATAAAPEHAVADYRMEEGKDLYVYDYANGPFGQLGLANTDWVNDGGHTALHFAENTAGRTNAGGAAERYLNEPAYTTCKHQSVVALAGHHGGSFDLPAYTLSAYIKPAAQMGAGKSQGDIIGMGARRVVLSLVGQKPPYNLLLRLNVNERFESKAAIEADKWIHVAATAEPTPEKKWKVKLYVDGKCVHEGVSEKNTPPLQLPPSLILGAEIFYLHDAFYRGLIGRVTLFDKALSEEELKKFSESAGK